MQPVIFATPDEMGQAAAELLASLIEAHTGSAGRRFLLGCPGGRTAMPVYVALAAEAEQRQLDLSSVVIVMMDEYVVTDERGDLAAEDPDAAHSCRRFGRVDIVERLNAALPPEHRIPEANLWLPDVSDPGAYDQRIADAGGIEVFLLASGASDGHVAFNPPGSERGSTTRVVELPASTRRDNLATFESFAGDLERVPRHGVTVGIDTIARHSKRAIMLAHGRDKSLAARRLTEAAGYEPDWPATIVSDCREAQLWLDRAAVGA